MSEIFKAAFDEARRLGMDHGEANAYAYDKLQAAVNFNGESVKRIESSVAEWFGEDLWSDRFVAVDKIGGGTPGHSYDGRWYVTVYDADREILWESDNLLTGTPHTHVEVAEIALSFQEEGSE